MHRYSHIERELTKIRIKSPYVLLILTNCVRIMPMTKHKHAFTFHPVSLHPHTRNSHMHPHLYKHKHIHVLVHIHIHTYSCNTYICSHICTYILETCIYMFRIFCIHIHAYANNKGKNTEMLEYRGIYLDIFMCAIDIHI